MYNDPKSIYFALYETQSILKNYTDFIKLGNIWFDYNDIILILVS